MNETLNSPICERAADVVAFLYDEATESEARDFKLHLKCCSHCRKELAALGSVRTSIMAWRDEALAGFISPRQTTHTNRKSAIAALRQFFDLAPLWLKGATAFGAVVLCVLVVVAVVRVRSTDNRVVATSAEPNLIYTEQDVQRIVKEALASQEKQPELRQTVEPPKLRNTKAVVRSKGPSRRPLSRAEREQLAADLRLVSTHDDVLLNLLGDRIDQ